jgi:hypothetical protein
MGANFSRADVSNVLASSSDPRVRSYAREAEVVQGVWNILNVSTDLMGDAADNGGSITGGSVGKFAVKKVLAVVNVGNTSANNQGVRAATFVAGSMISTVETGLEVMKYTSAAKVGVFITLKTAEKVVGAAGLADVDKCKLALASMSVSAGTSIFTCVATGGALCMLGAASFALEAWNAHEQCKLPPP